MEYDPLFNKILDLCNELDPYSVVTRYPKEKEITEHMAKIAINQAQEIYGFCMTKVPEL